MISSGSSIFRKKILVVDADSEFRDLFSLALKSDKLQIKTAENGHIALEILAQEAFDLILLDFRLPGFDGVQIIQELRKRNDFTRIVVASTFMPAKAVLDAVSYGVTSFVNKPSNLTLLRKTVHENLSEDGSPKTKAFQLARHLKFDAASRILEGTSRLNSELSTWQQVFKALSQGKQGNELLPYTGDLLEFALAHS